MGKAIVLVAIAVGVLLICSFFYELFFSGEPLISETIFTASDEKKAGNDLEWRTNPKGYKSVTLKLSPEMNPLSISVAVTRMYNDSGEQQQASYSVIIEDENGKAVVNKDINLVAEEMDPDKRPGLGLNQTTATSHAAYLDVPGNGQYRAIVSPGEPQELDVVEVQLRVRRNVSKPGKWRAVVGIVTCLGGMLYWGVVAARKIQAGELSIDSIDEGE